MRLLDVTIATLAGIEYDVVGDRRVPLRRIPTRPEGGLRIRMRGVGQG
jgi:hypothetical protein